MNQVATVLSPAWQKGTQQRLRSRKLRSELVSTPRRPSRRKYAGEAGKTRGTKQWSTPDQSPSATAANDVANARIGISA